LGTLLELGNCTLDILRDLVGRPAGQALAPTTSSSDVLEKPLDVKEGILTARHNLEAILIYSTTQLAMWLSKPDMDATGTTEMETDDFAGESQRGGETGKERRARRSSQTLTERMRRGMTGEMAADLQSLLNKAKPIIAKSKGVVGTTDVDVTPILSNFLHDRIGTPA
jgi:nuclear pore complex protein Nup188